MLMIRDITEADREEVVAMMKEFYGSPACLHTVPEENFHRTITAAIEKSPLARILVLEETDQSPAERITGYANLAITWNNEAGGIQVWFDELFFKSNARGKGYGTEVFQWLEKEYPQARRIRLEVTHKNTRAISLYERLGYEELPYYQMIKDKLS